MRLIKGIKANNIPLISTLLLFGCFLAASCANQNEKEVYLDEVQAFDHRTKEGLQSAVERHGEVNRARTRNYFDDLEQEKMFNENILEYEENIPFVGTRSIAVKKDLPPIFSELASLNEMQPFPLDMLANRLGVIGGMVVHFSDDVANPYREESIESSSTDSTDTVMTFPGNSGVEVKGEGSGLYITVRSYTGSFQGLLDRIASQLNISWEYDHNENVVVFKRFITKSYRLFNTPANTGMITSAGNQTSAEFPTLKISESLWSATQLSIESMLSAGGRVKVNEAAGIVTVTDTVFVHGNVGKMIEEMNMGSHRMVMLEMEFLTIRSSEEINRGAAFDILFGDGNATAGLVSGVADLLSGGGLQSLIVSDKSKFTGSQSIISSLNSLGHVHISDRQFIRALNNQITPFRDIEYIPYVSSQKTTVTDGVSSTSVEQEQVIVGYSLNVLPSIMDDGETMSLQLGVMQSELLGMETVETGDTFVQQPKRAERSFIENITAKSGDTVILTGFEQRKTTFADDTTFGKILKFLGFKNKTEDYYETIIVLVTPVVSSFGNSYQYE